MFFQIPWSLARGAIAGRRAVLLLVLAAVLYGFGMHSARACVKGAIEIAPVVDLAAEPPCHHDDADLAEAACEAHCRTDTQSGRLSLSFDLPAAAPVDFAAAPAPLVPTASLATECTATRRETGPPLHIVLHRLLR